MVTMLATPAKTTIFEDGAGDAPFNNPLGNLGLVKFDSTFRYLPFLPARTISTTVNIPANIGAFGRVINLGPHGQPGVPFIQGYATITAGVVPLCGSVLVRGPSTTGGMVTWSLGVDATNVFIVEERSFPTSIGSASNFPVVIFISSTLAG